MTLSEITSYVPQIDTLIRRLTESLASQKATKYANMFGMSLGNVLTISLAMPLWSTVHLAM